MMILNISGQLNTDVNNLGNSLARNVTLTVLLPASFTYVMSSPQATTQVGQLVTWTLGSIPSGYSESFVVTVTPTQGGYFTTESTLTTDNVPSIAAIMNDSVEVRVFDTTLCGVTSLTNGGGDTFDCYDLGTWSPPAGGTGFTGAWVQSNNPFLFPYGDSFDLYAVGFTGEMTLEDNFEGGDDVAYLGPWVDSDTDQWADSFDSYAVESPVSSALNGGTGFSGDWIIGT